jgi:glycosyltransferase involved in cell wall biosynthesis
MEKTGTLWVDLTDIIGWQGNFTGIQRVVYNVASRYAADPSVRFFAMRSSVGKVTFDPVSFDLIRRVQARADQPVPQTASVPQLAHARALARRVAARVPYARSVARRLRERSVTETPVRAVAGPFAAGDTVLVLGGNWSGTDYMPAIQTLRRRAGFRFYHVVYDLVPAFFTGYVPPEVVGLFTGYLERVCRTADGLIAISESTKRDCLKFMKDHGLKEIPVGVMRLGDESAKAAAGAKPSSPNPALAPGKFILCVSTVEIRKNHTLLYYMAQLARERGVKLPPIVLVGKLGWLAGDIQFILHNDPLAKGQFVIQRAVTDGQLEWLYRNCSFTIYPSFYEGWGLPIAESLVHGKPCLSSNTSSMPEVGGDLVDYFSPYDPAGCLDQVVRYLDPELLSRKAAAIAAGYHARSWDDAYADVQRAIGRE